MTNQDNAPPVGGEVVETASSMTVVEALSRAEIDVQIATAKRFPRSIKKFLVEAKDMACLTEEIASSCIYALPRAGKSIEGPSARLAEICMSAWGNCAGAARIIEEGNRYVVAQGVFKDYERNTAVTFEVRRRITNKQGRRFNDDMITVTSNAACSIAFRNAIFKGVPKAFWAPIYDAARATAIGDANTLANRRAQMLEYFQKMGVTEQQILGLLSKAGVEDLGGEDLLALKGLATAIKDGDTTVDQAFAPPGAVDPASPPTGHQPFGFDNNSDEQNAPSTSDPDPKPAEQAASTSGTGQQPSTTASAPTPPGDDTWDSSAIERFEMLVTEIAEKADIELADAEQVADHWLFKGKMKYKRADLADDGRWKILWNKAQKTDWA